MKLPNRGFTLIEVLVALVIAAVAFATVYQGLAQSIDATRQLRDHNYAMWLAQNRLAEHQLKRSWPSADTTDGKTEYVGKNWKWQEKVANTPEPDMRRIEIQIKREGEDITLVTLVGFLKKHVKVIKK